MLCDVVRRRRCRRRRRRWAHAPVIHAASHFDQKKRVAWVPISMHTCGSFFYNYGAPLGGPWGRRSSAINDTPVRCGLKYTSRVKRKKGHEGDNGNQRRRTTWNQDISLLQAWLARGTGIDARALHQACRRLKQRSLNGRKRDSGLKTLCSLINVNSHSYSR